MEGYGDFKRYNDYELLYLIQSGVEESRDIMLWKYSFMITSKLNYFKINQRLFDDYYQECYLTLLHTLKIYNDTLGMCFTNFFEKVLTRRIISLNRKNKINNDIVPLEEFDELLMNNKVDVDDNNILKVMVGLSKFEEEVYFRMYEMGMNTKDIASILGVNTRKVTQARQRVLFKIKKRLEMNK